MEGPGGYCSKSTDTRANGAKRIRGKGPPRIVPHRPSSQADRPSPRSRPRRGTSPPCIAARDDRANRPRTTLSAGFSIYHYEAITIGLRTVLDQLDLTDPAVVSKLADELRAIKLDPAFIAITMGDGKNSPGPLNQRIGFVEERLKNAFT